MTDMSRGEARAARGFERRHLFRHAIPLVTALSVQGCIDEDQRCAENQILVPEAMGAPAICACAPNTVPSAAGYGCTACGANETVQGTSCACNAGFARLTPGGPCEMSSIGAPCTGPGTCEEPFSYCAMEGTEQYCTVQGCDATSCSSGFTCEQQAGGTSYCAKLPVGLNRACTTDADCAGGEAKFCEAMFKKTCQISDCATGNNDCPGSYACCELIPGVLSMCTDPKELANGQCPFGMLVTP